MALVARCLNRLFAARFVVFTLVALCALGAKPAGANDELGLGNDADFAEASEEQSWNAQEAAADRDARSPKMRFPQKRFERDGSDIAATGL